MGKRKLRNCTNCRARHGPPTGKLCTRSEEYFALKNEEMAKGKVGKKKKKKKKNGGHVG